MENKYQLEYFCCIFPRNGYKIFSITGIDTSPIAPPRGIPPTSHSATVRLSATRSEFYVPVQSLRQHQNTKHQQQNKQVNANITSTTVFKPSYVDLPNQNKSFNFDDIHEQFRQLVMKDVLDYQSQREIKRRPLIEL